LVKRKACTQGKVIIQDAVIFYQWTSNHENSIKYVLYSAAQYDATVTELESRKAKKIQDTMQFLLEINCILQVIPDIVKHGSLDLREKTGQNVTRQMST
jgi:hypothetical protein